MLDEENINIDVAAGEVDSCASGLRGGALREGYGLDGEIERGQGHADAEVSVHNNQQLEDERDQLESSPPGQTAGEEHRQSFEEIHVEDDPQLGDRRKQLESFPPFQANVHQENDEISNDSQQTAAALKLPLSFPSMNNTAEHVAGADESKGSPSQDDMETSANGSKDDNMNTIYDTTNNPMGAGHIFDQCFPVGWVRIPTSSIGLRCGLGAVRNSLDEQYPQIQTPTLTALEALTQSDNVLDFIRESGDKSLAQDRNNFRGDQLAGVLQEWGRQQGLNLRLGIRTPDGVFLYPAPDGNQAFVWIWNNGVQGVKTYGHYEGLRPLGPSRLAVGSKRDSSTGGPSRGTQALMKMKTWMVSSRKG